MDDAARIVLYERIAREHVRDAISGRLPAEDVESNIAEDLRRVRVKAINDVTEWMRQHLSGISAPNEDDFAEMRSWLERR
jgi:hypothetical protein